MKKYVVGCCVVGVFIMILCFGLQLAEAADVVVTFGDSITAGYGSTPYSTYLQEMIGTKATVINEGVPGEFSGDGANRISTVLANDKPTYILIMEGANDADWGFSPSSVAYNLGVMIDKSRAAGATPIISTLTPNTRDTLTIPITDYNAAISALATEKGVTLVDAYGALVDDWPNLSWDGGMHPNVAGQKILANIFYDALPYKNSTSGGGGGGCFIATAAFGSLLAPKVVILEHFRDRFLLTNAPGKLFVKLYYHYSPPMAHFIARHNLLRAGVRLLLYPLIGFAYVLLHPALAFRLLFVACIMLVGAFWIKRHYGKTQSK